MSMTSCVQQRRLMEILDQKPPVLSCVYKTPRSRDETAQMYVCEASERIPYRTQ